LIRQVYIRKFKQNILTMLIIIFSNLYLLELNSNIDLFWCLDFLPTLICSGPVVFTNTKINKLNKYRDGFESWYIRNKKVKTSYSESSHIVEYLKDIEPNISDEGIEVFYRYLDYSLVLCYEDVKTREDRKNFIIRNYIANKIVTPEHLVRELRLHKRNLKILSLRIDKLLFIKNKR
jgi:hypothetical protein